MKLMSRHGRSAPQRGQGRQTWLQLASTSGNRLRSISARGRFPYTPRAISLRHPMVSPFPFLLLRRGWQDRAALDAAWRDPINRLHDAGILRSRTRRGGLRGIGHWDASGVHPARAEPSPQMSHSPYVAEGTTRKVDSRRAPTQTKSDGRRRANAGRGAAEFRC